MTSTPDDCHPRPSSKPPPSKLRRGHRSTRAGIRRKLVHAIKRASLADLLEVVIDHDILLIRPQEGVAIRYGYPVTKPKRGLHPSDYDPPSTITAPSAHAQWVINQHYDIRSRFGLPTMLQATAAASKALTAAELRWIRHHNQKALEDFIASHKGDTGLQSHRAASHWQLSTIQLLVSLTHHIDTNIVTDLSEGFPISGDIPSGGLFPNLPKPRLSRCRADALRVVPADVRRLSSYLRSSTKDSRLQQAVVDDVHTEVSLGRALGPFPIVDDMLPRSILFASPVFAIDQISKIRLISNYSFRVNQFTFNQATTTRHKVEMPRLGHVASLMAVSATDDSAFHLARIDHQAAYRQLPIPLTDASRAAGLFLHTDGTIQAVQPLVAPFGAIGSVSAYLRIGELHCHFARCLGLCSLFSYMDDYFPVERCDTCESAFEFFLFINSLTGAQVKSSKTIPPASCNELLGLEVDLSHGLCRVRLTSSRRERILSELLAALNNHSLLSSKLTGKLSFCCEALLGRLGRAQTRILIRASQGIQTSSDTINFAITSLLDIFSSRDYVRDLLQEVRLTTSPFICYSDASSGFGLGIAAPQQFTIPRLAGKLKLAPTTTHINLLEIIAAGAALESFRDYISTKPALIFVDSTTCESLIIRGSTISPILNIIGGKFWKRVAELGITTLFVAHVASKLNYADSLSRGGDLEEFECDVQPLPVVLPPWVEHCPLTSDIPR